MYHCKRTVFRAGGRTPRGALRGPFDMFSQSQFRELVREAIDLLPEEFGSRMENVQILVEDEPSAELREEMGLQRGQTLFGLYQGVPLTERTTNYMNLPDTITIFRKPILRLFHTPPEIRREIARTVIHEIAHHFGIDDDRIEDLGWG